MKRVLVTILTASCVTFATAAQAKLPASQLKPEQQAKAVEAKAKAKAAEAAKKEGELLGKAQDRAADHYKKVKGRTVAIADATSPAKKK